MGRVRPGRPGPGWWREGSGQHGGGGADITSWAVGPDWHLESALQMLWMSSDSSLDAPISGAEGMPKGSVRASVAVTRTWVQRGRHTLWSLRSPSPLPPLGLDLLLWEMGVSSQASSHLMSLGRNVLLPRPPQLGHCQCQRQPRGTCRLCLLVAVWPRVGHLPLCGSLMQAHGIPAGEAQPRPLASPLATLGE